MADTCGTCRFFYPAEELPGTGQCRRLAPGLARAADPRDLWPTIWVSAWCGEHEPRPEFAEVKPAPNAVVSESGTVWIEEAAEVPDEWAGAIADAVVRGEAPCPWCSRRRSDAQHDYGCLTLPKCALCGQRHTGQCSSSVDPDVVMGDAINRAAEQLQAEVEAPIRDWLWPPNPDPKFLVCPRCHTQHAGLGCPVRDPFSGVTG